jgi:hypothetical protein
MKITIKKMTERNELEEGTTTQRQNSTAREGIPVGIW